jgi:head decoration protein D
MANPIITNNDFRPLVLGGAQYDARTVVTGQTLVAGNVVGIITASGKLTLCDKASADGSQVAAAVMTKAVDASGGDVSDVDVLISGEVDGDQLTFGGASVLADHFDELRDVSIIAVDTAKIGGQDNQ